MAPGQLYVHWIPGHSGIQGNELADKQASLGDSLPTIPTDTPPLIRYAWAHRILKRALHRCFENYWTKHAPPSYRDLAIPLDPLPSELFLPRGSLGRLLAARSGHGDFAQYHERFNHENALLFCSCGQRKSPQHFCHCLKGKRTAQHTWAGLSCKETLRTKEGALLFNEWLLKSNFYSHICPAH